MKTLIVDDEIANQSMLEHMLKPYGAYRIAGSGVEAVALFEQHFSDGAPFDLVLMDIMMPNMSGHDALKAIRKIEKNACRNSLTAIKYSCIIMQTVLDDPKYLVNAFFDGRCNGYITKPFTQDELVEKLKAHKLI